MNGSLLTDIYLLGEELTSALQTGDLDQYFELLEKRGTLLDCLEQYEHPSEIDPNWEEIAEALQNQHQALTTALREQERKMERALADIERLKGASRSYNRTEPRPQILNQNLRV